MPIKAENWDGVSAGSIPAGWTVDSPATTDASPVGGITPLSSPNVLSLFTVSANVTCRATWNVADSNGGDVVVSASFNSDNNAVEFGVMARGSTTSLGTGTPDYYWARFSPGTSGGFVKLYKVVSGTPTQLGSTVSLAAAATSPAWYLVEFDLVGTSLSVYVSRASDGYFVDNTGNWASSRVAAISLTDASISGAGYAGLTLQTAGHHTYSDDWLFDAYSSAPPPQTPTVMLDRIKEVTTTIGTGALALDGAVSGYTDFSAVGDGNMCFYAISDVASNNWEVGIGTYASAGPSLSRDAVFASSNGGGLVAFPSGTKEVFVTAPGRLLNRMHYVAFDHITDSGSVSTTETDLYSDSIPAGFLLSDGDKISCRYTLTLVNSASTKRVRLYFAGTAILDTGAMTMSASGSVVVDATIIRDSATSVRYGATAAVTGTTGPTAIASAGKLTSLTLSSATILKVTGQAAGGAAANNDVLAILGSVSRHPAG